MIILAAAGQGGPLAASQSCCDYKSGFGSVHLTFSALVSDVFSIISVLTATLTEAEDFLLIAAY